MLMTEPQPYRSVDGQPIAVVPIEPFARMRLGRMLENNACDPDDIAPCIMIDGANTLDEALTWCAPHGSQSVMFDVDRNAAATAANAVVICADGIAGHLDPVTADILFEVNSVREFDYRRPVFPVIATFAIGDAMTDVDVTDVISTLGADNLSVNPTLDGRFQHTLVETVCRYGLVPLTMADPNALEMLRISTDTCRALTTQLRMMSDYQRAEARTNALQRILTQVHDLCHWRKAAAQNNCDRAMLALVDELSADCEN